MYVPINKNSNTPMAKQIYFYIKSNILDNSLCGNYRLPSSRALAKELSVSRNVVLNAYDQLFAEGYLYSKERSGVFVTDGLSISTNKNHTQINYKHHIGLQFEKNKEFIDFRTGVPNLALFPKAKWGKLYRDVCLDTKSSNLDYYQPCGSYELRTKLCKYLSRVRGVCASPENIIITSGAAQSFSLLIQYFSKINKNIIAEDPMSLGITKILNYFCMKIHPVPVDEHGLMTNSLPDNRSSLIFTTPSHQFPTGAVLPINRRVELINYAKKTGAYIVEDDYDSEFRYEGYPIQSMQSLAPDNIIYVGTFSKTLCPALRIGYMILPENLASEIKSIKYIDDLHSPILEQLTLSRFIEGGMLDRHLAVSRKHYSKKCEYLVHCLKSAFGDTIEIYGHTAGIHLMVRFKNKAFSKDIVDKIRKNGVNITLASDHSISSNEYNDCLLFGFGNLSDSEINNGIESILKTVLVYFSSNNDDLAKSSIEFGK